MTRVHAFGDDALGDLDAVGLVGRIQSGRGLGPGGRRGRDRPDRAGRPGAERDRPRRVRAGPRRGPEPARRLLRRRAELPQGQRRRRGDADPARHRRLRAPRRSAATATSPGCSWRPGLVPLGKTRLSEFGFSPSAEHPRLGAVRYPWDTDAHGRRLVGRVGGAGRGRRRPDRARQRRRRLDPDPGRGQRAGRPQADPGPVAAGQADARHAGPDRLRRRRHPLGARHRGVLPRGREGLPRPPAAAGR